MDNLFKIATGELGQIEIAGAGNNPAIVNYAYEAGFNDVNDDETSWCSIFMNWVAMKAGLQQSKKLNARSWLLTGIPVDKPEPGDVVVFWRESIDSWKGHVGIFFGFSDDSKRVFCLGGNQGNQVSISGFPKENVLGYRRLTKSDIIQIPDKILKLKDTGDDVKMLQDALKSININCGTSDGIYGPKTENAVKQLQAMNRDQTANGIYDTTTYKFFLTLINQ